MKWALVLALVLCCGSTRGHTENESGDTSDNSGSILVKDYLLRNGDVPPETGEDQSKVTEGEPDSSTDDPPAQDMTCADEAAQEDCKSKGAHCVDTLTNSDKQKTYKCECSAGLTLTKDKGCVDLCESITCQNGIKCKEGKCPCEDKPGLSGDSCEVVNGCAALSSACEKIGKDCIYDSNRKDNAICDCGADKKFDGTECKETCEDDPNKCPLNTECKLTDGYSFCVCKEGLTGDKCDVIIDCQPSGKYENCTEVGGNCTYDGTNSVCICKNNKEYDTLSKTCRETCDGDANKCAYKTECKLIDGYNFCVCPNGLTGDKCDEITDCQPSGKYANCVKAGGNCTHDGTNSVCICKDNKEYDTLSKTCRATCDPTNSECANGANCEVQDGKNFCTCVPGLTGDSCQVITDCQRGRKYENCTDNHKCTFSKDDRKAFCECADDKQFDIKRGRCEKTCEDDGQCGTYFRCGEPIEEYKFCVCKDDITGYDCDLVKDCLPSGKYANCKKAGGSCWHTGTISKCDCKDGKGYDTKSEACRATCDPSKSECANGANCEVQDEKNFCTCVPGLTGDFCQNITACETGGTYEKCSTGGGTCNFTGGQVTCVCETDKQFDIKSGQCRSTCDENTKKCGNGAKCENQGGQNFCTCVEGLSGDLCEKINECQPNGKYEKCKSGGGTCTFSGGIAGCSCETGKLFDLTVGQCKDACGSEICRNGAQCKDGKCECPTGISGKDCGIIDGCTEDFEKICKAISTKCIYDSKEENKASCECTKDKQKFDGENCKECDCGTNGNCSFVNGEKECECNDLYKEDEGICKICDCGENGVCSFKDHKQTCDCDDGFKELDGACKACNCGEDGECSFINKKKNCTCNEGYSEYNGICTEPCKENEDCEHNTTCKEKTKGVSFCDCKKIFTGHKCENVVACETGDLKACKKSGGTCSYNLTEKKAVCECNEEKKFDDKLNICRAKCKPEGDTCKNGAKCQDELCVCPKGTSGDDCATVDGCDPDFKEKCENIKATCVYDNTTNSATCQCENNDLEYKDNKCTAKWCDPNPCKAEVSVCIYGFRSAFCKCKGSGKYYDYATNNCIAIDKCPFAPCKENEICTDDGTCVCDKNHEKDKDGCKKKNLCTPSPCSLNATCEEGKSIGTVKCECPSHTYLNAKSTCEVIIKEEDKCKDGKDCGPFGYCVKKGDAFECACKNGLAVLDKDKGVCILNGPKACLSKKVLSNNNNKCNCSETLKDSKNGITCEYMTCGDEATQKDCKSKGAYCVDTKDSNNKLKTYECKCSAGLTLTDKGCVDACSANECSKNQQTCYLDENGFATCKCPPGFTEIKSGGKTTCQLNAQLSYLLKGLPVMAKEFLNIDQSVNKVKLNQYVIKSMKALSSTSYEFASVQNFRISDDVILCDVWLKFNKDAEQDVKRWRSQVLITNDSIVLPPSLKLSSVELGQVTHEKLEFCSPLVYQTVCGRQGSKCDKNACSCMDGYDVVGPTVQVIEGNTVMRCEDIDECKENKHSCRANSECENIMGGHYCKCLPGFHKKDKNESEDCVELCSPNPCTNGDCAVNERENRVECSCKAGFKGSYCTESDDKLKQAQHSTKVVGAVLGTILAVTFVAIIAYVVKLKKNSYSEDFSSGPRDNSEMAERPLRGMSNRGYQ